MQRIAGVLVICGILSLSLAGSWLAAVSPAAESLSQSGIPVATLLYVDAGHASYDAPEPYKPTGGLGTRRWNLYGGDPPYPFTGFTTTWPEIGFYKSQAESTIAWQLGQMQRAEINTVIISWSGWGDVDLDGTVDDDRITAQVDRTTRMILDYITDNDLPFKFSFLVEDFPHHEGFGGAKSLDHSQRLMVTDHLWEKYFGVGIKYGHKALRLNDRPTVFSVSVGGDASLASTAIPDAWWGRHGFMDDRFELIEVAEYSGIEDLLTSVYVYEPPPSSIPGKDGIVTIWPRFSNAVTFMSQNRDFPHLTKDTLSEVDPTGREGLYDAAWEKIIEHPLRSEIKMVWAWYWNSYWEVAYLEPDAGIGSYAVGDLFVRKTAHYSKLLKSGGEFIPFDESLSSASPASGEAPSEKITPLDARSGNIIEGTLIVNGEPKNGVTAKLWPEEAFRSPPKAGDAEPRNQDLQIAPSTVTGPRHGGDGAYRFTRFPDGDYYVSLTFDNTVVWEGHSVHTDSGTHRLRSQALEIARVGAGQSATLAHIKGSGVVRHVFVALTSSVESIVEDDSWIRVYVNGSTTPSISTPVSQFFAYSNQAEPFQNEKISLTRKNNWIHENPETKETTSVFDRGAYRYIDIPYGSEVRIDLDVGAKASLRVWSTVYYHETPVPLNYGRRNHLEGKHLSRTNVAPYSAVELLNVEGRGTLDSMVLSGRSPDGHQVLEGNLEIYVDGERAPSVYIPGTEDITANAFYFGFDQLVGPRQGTTAHDGGRPVRWTQYRFFDSDRIDFNTSLRIVWEAGHKGQADFKSPVDVESTILYYINTAPTQHPEPRLDLVIDEDFRDYSRGQSIDGPWKQRPNESKWTRGAAGASFKNAEVFDAWMYHAESVNWPDQIVEADVRINKFGTGEIWLFARGTPEPNFNQRVTFGFSAAGAEPAHPNYQPVMLFASSEGYSESSLLLVPANQLHTLRLEVDGDVVIASLKREGDREFRQLFRHIQTERIRGFSGVSAVRGDVTVEGFRVYRK